MVSCHCCGVFALHFQELAQHSSTVSTDVTLHFLDSILIYFLFVTHLSVQSLWLLLYQLHIYFKQTRNLNQFLSHFHSHWFFFFAHILTVICGYGKTCLHRVGWSGTADVLSMWIRLCWAILVFDLACVFISSDLQTYSKCRESLWVLLQSVEEHTPTSLKPQRSLLLSFFFTLMKWISSSINISVHDRI